MEYTLVNMRIIIFLFISFFLTQWLGAQYGYPSDNFTDKGGGGTAAYANNAVSNRIVMLLGDSKEGYNANNIESELSRMLGDAGSEKLKPRQYKKKLEEISDRLEKNYFKTYSDYVGFEQLFKRGAYNSATATALYVLILERYQIPYHIVVEPNSVFPVVDPGNQKIALKTGPAGKRELAHFNTFYIKLLKDIGLVSAEDLTRQSESDLIKQYYGPLNEQINLTQLAGVLHYQQALAYYKSKQFDEALGQIDKAAQLYKTPRNEVIRYSCLFQLALKAEPGDVRQLEYLLELYRLHPVANVRNEVIQHFMAVANQCLFEQCQADQLQGFYGYLRTRLEPTAPLFTQLRDLYFLQMAKYYARNGQTGQLITCLDSVYYQRPNDKRIQEALSGLLVESLRQERDFAKGLAELDTYSSQYPFLVQHPYFRDLELYYRAEQLKSLFDGDREKEAIKALADFESALTRFGSAPRAVNWITTTYAAAAYYYFRWKDYRTARQMIERAIALAPGDAYLENQLELMKAYER